MFRLHEASTQTEYTKTPFGVSAGRKSPQGIQGLAAAVDLDDGLGANNAAVIIGFP